MDRHGVIIGIGFRPGVSADDIRAALDLVLADALPCVPIALATLDRRTEEAGLVAVANARELPILGFSAARLEEETPRLLNPSERVFRAIGCHGVAESAALAAAGSRASLILPKRRHGSVTVAMAGPADAIDN